MIPGIRGELPSLNRRSRLADGLVFCGFPQGDVITRSAPAIYSANAASVATPYGPGFISTATISGQTTIDYPCAALSGTVGFSIACWAAYSTSAAFAGMITTNIIEGGSNSLGWPQVAMYITSSRTSMLTSRRDASGAEVYGTSAVGLPVYDSKWHHYVATFSAGRVTWYIDGVVFGSANAIGGNLTDPVARGTGTKIWINGLPVTISNACMVGMSAMPSIWRRVLYPGEVASLYQKPFSLFA